MTEHPVLDLPSQQQQYMSNSCKKPSDKQDSASIQNPLQTMSLCLITPSEGAALLH